MGKFIEISVQEKKMQAYLATPDNNIKPTRGIILLQEAFGVNAHIQDIAQRFAKLGFAVIAPEIFHRTAPTGFTCAYDQFDLALPHFSAITPENLIADCQASYNYLKSTFAVEDISSIGYCLGGRANFIINTELNLRASISFYGGRIAPNHLDLAAKQKAPLLLFWGGQDLHIPKEDRRSIADALTKAQKKFTEVEFSWAEHGFFCDERASFNQQARDQSWQLALEFLNFPQ